MPEIKNSFTQGKMNKDLDERLIPNGQYRHAENVEVSVSEGSDAGTVRNILGNSKVGDITPPTGSICVGSISNEKTNKLYWFLHYDSESGRDAIIEYDHATKRSHTILCDLFHKDGEEFVYGENTHIIRPFLKFSGKQITGINIIDDFLFWTDGENEPKKVNIKLAKQRQSFLNGGKTVSDHSRYWLNPGFESTADPFIQEHHLTVVRKKPSIAPTVNVRPKRPNDPRAIFGKIFPRFCFRYKYADGEYSAFGPFTNVVFNPIYELGSDITNINYYSVKDVYNTAMFNSIVDLDIMDFVPTDIPDDVVQVDILYKQENSNVIYSIANIKKTDPEFSNQGSQSGYAGGNIIGFTDDYSSHKGSYKVDSENIHAALPENQLLRPWDNVPKKALAQEVTGSRIVYANYTQGYDLNNLTPSLTAEYAERFYYIAGDNIYDNFNLGGQKTIKSQRDYRLGIVYGDKYGRETPVFTSPNASVQVPWSDASFGPITSKSLLLKAATYNQPPEWADYYKFYVKQTSGEYYNVLMNSAYRPGTHTDFENEQGHLWLVFNSVDRNKVSEDDYIIMKKVVNNESQQVFGENKYKVLDIKNEAPESIAYNFRPMGSFDNTNDVLSNDGFTNTIFVTASKRPDFLSGETGTDIIWIKKSEWLDGGNGGSSLGREVEVNEQTQIAAGGEKNIYMSWNDSATGEYSSRYKISNVRIHANTTYVLKLSKPISVQDANLANNTETNTKLNNNLVFRIEQKERKDGEEFSGKFFVEVLADDKLRDTIFDDASDLVLPNTVTSQQDTYFFADQVNVSFDSTESEQDGIVNSQNASTIQALYTDGDPNIPADVSSHTGNALSRTEADWEAFHADLSIGIEAEPSGAFFIDSMHMAAGNNHPDSLARESGRTWYGNYFQQGTRSYPNIAWGVVNASGSGSDRDFGWYFPGQGLTEGYNDDVGFVINSNNPAGATLSPGTFGSFNLAGDVFFPPAIGTVAEPSTAGINAKYFSDGNNYAHTERIVNGLEGIIDATEEHVYGPRRWVGSSIYSSLAAAVYGDVSHTVTSTGVGGVDFTGVSVETGKFFLHVSFFAPGVDLHDGSGFDNMNNFDIDGKDCLGKNLQGIWGGGAFTKTQAQVDADKWTFGDEIGSFNTQGIGVVSFEHTEPGLNVGTAFLPVPAPGPSVDFASNTTPAFGYVQVGYNPEFENEHLDQWNPTKTNVGDPTGEIQTFIDNLSPGSKFKFSSDTDSEIYKILDVTPKHLYNHTPWRARYIWDGSNYVLGGDSVEEAAVAWADTIDGGSYGTTESTNLKNKIIDFGKANNRRICYIIELDKDPRISNFNPLAPSAATDPDVNTPTIIQFLDDNSQVVSGKVTKTPVVWETEPKDKVELDIYYEASNSIPVKLTDENREIFAPIGCYVRIVNNPNPPDDEFDMRLLTWDANETDLVAIGSGGENSGFLLNGTDGIAINYLGLEIQFVREDGSYTSALISGFPKLAAGVSRHTAFNIKLDATLESGLSWYNCFTFGDGVESNRIRDDFNQMQITNGARASATLEEPYNEEHRKHGLIYSGLYNSNSGLNNLNQFIMAEKITKDLNPTYGSIQKLFSRATDLIALCEDKVIKILANKDAVFNADGNPQLVASPNVLGQTQPFVGDYGISKNPESFASESYRAYFTDKQRGAVLRLSMDGLTPISDAGMRDYFRDNLSYDEHGDYEESSLLGTYNSFNKEYNVTKTSLYYENILKNQFIQYGEASVSEGITGTNIVLNTQLAGGGNYTPVDIDADIWDGNTGHALTASQASFNHTVTITNYPAINVGAEQAFDAGQEEQTFEEGEFSSGGNIRIFSDGFLATQNTDQNPFDGWNVNSSPVQGTGSGVPRAFIQRNVFLKSYQSPSGVEGYFQYGSNSTSVSWDLGDGYPWNSSTPDSSNIGQGETYDASTEGFGAPNYDSFTTSNSTYTAVNAMPGSPKNYPLVYLETGDNTPTPTAVNLIDAGAFEYDYDNPTAHAGITFRNLRPQDENQGSAYIIAPRAWNDPHSNVASWDADLQVPTLIKEKYPSAFNNTIFNGEEVMVTFKVKLNHHNPDYPTRMQIRLLDGGAHVSNNIITNALPQNAVGDFTGDAYNNILYSESNATVSGNFKGYRNFSYTVFNDLEDNTTGEQVHRAFFKFSDGTSDEKILVDTLRLRIQVHMSESDDYGVRTEPVITLIQLHKKTQLSIPEIEQQDFEPELPAVPAVQVPAWAEVIQNDPSGWSENVYANLTYGGEQLYGLTHEGSNFTENNVSYYAPPGWDGTAGSAQVSNGVVFNGDENDGDQPVNFGLSDVYFFGGVGSTSKVSFDIGNNPYVVDDWYLIDVYYNPSQTENTDLNFLYIPGVLGNSPSIHQARINNSDHNSDDPNYPEFSFGKVRGNVNEAYSFKGIELYPVVRTEYGTSNLNMMRGIFQYKAATVAEAGIVSIGDAYNQDLLEVRGHGFTGIIKSVFLLNISQSPTMSSPSNWNTPSFNYESPHAFSEFITLNTVYDASPEVYYKDNLLSWNTDGSDNKYWNQSRPVDNPIPADPSTDGYEFKFTVENIAGTSTTSGSLVARLGNSIGDFSPTEFAGVIVDNVDLEGQYRILMNFDDSTPTILEKPSGSSATANNVQESSSSLANSTLTGHSNRITFLAGSQGFTGGVKDITLTDNTNYFTGGGVDSWTFTGFDVTQEIFIAWDVDNQRIAFNDAPGYSSTQPNQRVLQTLDISPLEGDYYRVKFDYNITSGSITGYYFSSLLETKGFTLLENISGSGTYDEVHMIGENSGQNHNPSSSQESGTWAHLDAFVITIDSHSSELEGPTNGFIDNISLKKSVSIGFKPTTVSFSEDVKGWTSFKSFIPESGANVGNRYFTMKNGEVYEHHVNPNRNKFYEQLYPSSITAVLNQSASTVKSFKTLNYEGDKGWVVDEVVTDLQKGSISEFVKKEGKWFNYIKGKHASHVDQVGSFNFQGLGVIDYVEYIGEEQI